MQLIWRKIYLSNYYFHKISHFLRIFLLHVPKAPFPLQEKPYLKLYSLLSFDGLCKLSSISETIEDCGFIVVLSKQQLCFHAIKKIIEIITNWKSSLKFSLTFDNSCQAHFLGEKRAGVSAVMSHHKVPVVGWITDTSFCNSQIQTSDLLYILWRHTL